MEVQRWRYHHNHCKSLKGGLRGVGDLDADAADVDDVSYADHYDYDAGTGARGAWRGLRGVAVQLDGETGDQRGGLRTTQVHHLVSV